MFSFIKELTYRLEASSLQVGERHSVNVCAAEEKLLHDLRDTAVPLFKADICRFAFVWWHKWWQKGQVQRVCSMHHQSGSSCRLSVQVPLGAKAFLHAALDTG